MDKLRVLDEYQQPWDMKPGDVLWNEAVAAKNRGEDPIVMPLQHLVMNRGWGWWTVLEKQRNWAEKMGIPAIDEEMMPISLEDVPLPVLRNKLQLFGAYATRLEAIVGEYIGLVIALKDSLGTAISIGTTEIDDKKMSEKAKEAMVLESSETLRQTKRQLIEAEALLATAKGMCNAYGKAWDTISRQMTAQMSEQRLASERVS